MDINIRDNVVKSPVFVASAKNASKPELSGKEDVNEPLDTFQDAPQPSGLPDFKALLKLMKTKDFVFPSDKKSLEKMASLSGQPLTQKELVEARKELSGFIQDARETGEAGRVGKTKKVSPPSVQWANLAEASVKDSLESIKRVSRDIGWEKVVGPNAKDIPATYEKYFKSTSVPIDEMKQVLAVREDLNSPDSKMKLKGNNITPLMREEIWETKMELLDKAIKNPVKNGKPVEINAEYYEMSSSDMIDRLTAASSKGAKVSVVMDPGTLSYVSKDTFDATSLAVRSATVEKLLRGQEDNDMSVALFPVKERLGSRSEIMHRKLFRVGEDVVFGGMNANRGSNENVDFAMKINGPAATKVGEMFREDAQGSAGKSVEQIYGNQMELIRDKNKDVMLSQWGFEGLLSSRFSESAGLTGNETREQQIDKLIEAAGKDGFELNKFADFSDLNKDGEIDSGDVRTFLLAKNKIPMFLNDEGKEFLASTIEKNIDRINSGKNISGLSDITPPDGKIPRGQKANDVVAVGSEGFERQALLLESISSADKFVNISAFVLNKDLAGLLVEKKKEMESQGKQFDVKVVMDPGLYGYGGTPNEEAYKILEDAGVDVKWNLLERSVSGHDRKNHSKLIFTDKMLMTGSTNFSSKGLRDNWEANDIVYFNEDDPSSIAKQQSVIDKYDTMFEREAIGIDTLEAAKAQYAGYKGADKELLVDQYRNKVIREACRTIENYEMQSASYIAQKSPDLVRNAGESGGYDILNSMTEEDVDVMRESLSTWHTLQKMSRKS